MAVSLVLHEGKNRDDDELSEAGVDSSALAVLAKELPKAACMLADECGVVDR